MVGDGAFYDFGAAIANFDVIFVKKSMKFMIFGEVLFEKIEKLMTNLCRYCFTKRRIRLGNISFTIDFVLYILNRQEQ